jgi:hypothetical protein
VKRTFSSDNCDASTLTKTENMHPEKCVFDIDWFVESIKEKHGYANFEYSSKWCHKKPVPDRL